MIKTLSALLLLSAAAGYQEKGGKLPWFKGTPQEGLAQAKKEGKNAFLYFTSKG